MSESEYLTTLFTHLTNLHDAGIEYLAELEEWEELEPPTRDEGAVQIRREVLAGLRSTTLARLRDLDSHLGPRLLKLARESGCADPEGYGVRLLIELGGLHRAETVRAAMVRVQTLMVELVAIRKFFAAPDVANDQGVTPEEDWEARALVILFDTENPPKGMGELFDRLKAEGYPFKRTALYKMKRVCRAAGASGIYTPKEAKPSHTPRGFRTGHGIEAVDDRDAV